jgi:RNA polymerase sigma factor (sigma-70 family)
MDETLGSNDRIADRAEGNGESSPPAMGWDGSSGLSSPDDHLRGRLWHALERNARSLWRFLLVRVGGDNNLAEELMQETCLQAARSDPPEDDGRCDAWLFGVARNVLRRHWRTITRRRRNLPEVRTDLAAELGTLLDAAPMPGDCLERQEVWEQLWLALTALPADDQELIVQHYFDGRAQTDLAAERNTSARAIEGRLYRARQALREKLQHLEDERLG